MRLKLNTTLYSVAFAILLSSTGYAATNPAQQLDEAAKSKNAKEALPPYKLNSAFKSDEAQLSYSFGTRAAQFFKAANIPIDIDQYVQGVKDGATGQMKLTQPEIQSTLVNFQKQQITRQKEQMKQLAEKNLKESNEFLEKNKTQKDVKILNDAIQYKILHEGKGPMPKLGDTVTVHYEGKLANGQVFDSSYKRNKPVTLRVDQVIQGWQTTLTHMPTGSTWEVVIPPHLGYGEQGTGFGGPIGPNQVLVFKIELISIDNKNDKK